MVRIRGTEKRDVFEGTAAMERYFALGGNDVVRLGGGNDVADGGDGDDRLDGDAGDDRLMGGVGFDALDGGAGDDVLIGGADVDRLFGGDGDDRLFADDPTGNLAADPAYEHALGGGAGDDIIVGSSGVDEIDGHDGNDVIFAGTGTTAALFSSDKVRAGAGNDTIHVADDGIDAFGEDGDDRLTGGAGYDRFDGGGGNDRASGDAGGDYLLGGAGDDRIRGEAGDDALSGGAGNDRLIGGEGNDKLYAGSVVDRLPSDDVLIGGAGDDTLYGAPGARLEGGEGFDRFGLDLSRRDLDEGIRLNLRIVEQGGKERSAGMVISGIEAIADLTLTDRDDRLVLPETMDTRPNGLFEQNGYIYMRGGDDKLVGGGRALVAFGGDGHDDLVGGVFGDLLSGGNGDDRLSGDAGDDAIEGGYGDDRLYGGDGDDSLAGGFGRDVMTGGAGADTFSFEQVAFGPSESGGPGVVADVILDFDRAEGDLLRIITPYPAFFAGKGAFTGQRGEIRWEVKGGATFVHVDHDGDAVSDIDIRLAGVIALTRDDFRTFDF